jgi:phosphopantothenoylcysteine decarboxylase/phosphopantothenate--cysteine ligase
VAFRAEYKLSKHELIESAHARLLEAKADLIVVNDVGKKGVGFGTETNEVFIIDKNKKEVHVPLASKREVARRILDAVRERVKPK